MLGALHKVGVGVVFEGQLGVGVASRRKGKFRRGSIGQRLEIHDPRPLANWCDFLAAGIQRDNLDPLITHILDRKAGRDVCIDIQHVVELSQDSPLADARYLQPDQTAAPTDDRPATA